MWKLFCCLLALGLITPTQLASAQIASAGGEKPSYVRVTLLAEQQSLVPGAWVGIGFHFAIEPNWHLYWQFPGDSGQEPRVTWSLPAGAEIEPLTWPLPEIIKVGPLVNYGYESELLLATRIKLPEQYEQQSHVVLEAAITWLVCAHVCVPGRETVRLQLPIGNTEDPSDKAPLFATFRQQVPKALPPTQQVQAYQQGQQLVLELTPPLKSALFFPLEGDQIAHGGTQHLSVQAEQAQLTIPIAGMRQKPLQQLTGVLIDTSQKPAQGYQIQLPVQQRATVNTLSLLWLAFLGGILLNLMPCVFPVLSLKVLSLLHLRPQERQRFGQHAFDYTAGVLLSFWSLALLLRLLQQIGHQLGWGFQLQSPAFVAGLAGFFFLLGLNMLGVLEFGGEMMGIGQHMQQRSDRLGTMMTGLLATLVATPCSAPFMGTAIGYAMTATLPINLLIFTCLGLGLAFPYVLLCLQPNWMIYLPRPGPWMIYLKEALSFTLFGTSVWLIWIFSQQQSQWALILLLLDLWAISLMGWVIFRFGQATWLYRLGWLAMLFIFVHMMWAAAAPSTSSEQTTASQQRTGETTPYDGTIVAQLQAAGNMVLVDFTAAWCVTCQINEKVVLQSAAVQTFFQDNQVVLVKADWTNYDAEITKILASFGRNAIPFYLIYSNNPEAAPEILTDLLTEASLKEAIAKAKVSQLPRSQPQPTKEQ